uniref:Uncharacterized protein n=1 Tax=Rhizophora mucronata TaxID=61149 RepID=A0A2P2R2R7_RHIMU
MYCNHCKEQLLAQQINLVSAVDKE